MRVESVGRRGYGSKSEAWSFFERRIDARLGEIVPNSNGCLIWNGTLSGQGKWKYARLTMKWGGGRSTSVSVSRFLLARKLQRPLRKGYDALHTCDDTRCVNEDHLYEGTDQDNCNDRMLRNRGFRGTGELNPNALLTDDTVLEMLSLYYGKHATRKQLAEKFGVSYVQVCNVIRGDVWQHITVPFIGIASYLKAIGYDPSSEHFHRTPARWIRAMLDFRMPKITADDILAVDFGEKYDGLVVCNNIEYSMMCPHHLMTVTGVAHVGYIPGKERVVGISKLARLAEFHTHRIVTQEAATKGIADDLTRILQPRGAAVVLKGTHSCMSTRGVRKEGASLVTSSLTGVFLDNAHGCRDEFLRLIQP